MTVVDTEFLFALRATDPQHDLARRILSTGRPLIIPQIAIIETMLVLLSRGKSKSEVIRFFKALDAVIKNHHMETANFELSQLMEGLLIWRDIGKGGLFDCLIAGAAKEIAGTILGNDDYFVGIPGLKRRTFHEFLSD